MDPGILILPILSAILSVAAQPSAATTPAKAAGSVLSRTISDTARQTGSDSIALKKDSARSDSGRMPPGLEDRTPAWAIPDRDGSAGGALNEAFRLGDPNVPWARVFEYDGMWEDWSPWPSLPIVERAVRLSWTGSSLAGASDAGPLQVVAVAKESEPGMGGAPIRRELSAPSPVDTPRTELQFWRGALASYRFGLDFSRAVAGPWGIALRMGTRSAQGRSWMYRDQIQDMFQGSFGRAREDLPANGRSPGQDDVQWEMVVSRATPGLLIEAGWNWVDLQRGIPDPRMRWGATTDLPPILGQDSRSGWFGRVLGKSDEISVSVSGRMVGQDWKYAGWNDSGAFVPVVGSVDHQEVEGDLHWGGALVRLGATGRGALRTGNTSSSTVTFQEDVERFGGYVAVGGSDGLRFKLDAGWSRLNDPYNRTMSGPDGLVAVDWSGASLRSHTRVSRELRFPDWEVSILPDPLLRTLPSRNLSTEERWFAETRQSLQPWRWLSLDAGAAALLIDDAIQPVSVPTVRSYTMDEHFAMRLANAKATVRGWSGQLGARASWSQAWIGSQWAFGATMAPGEDFSGLRDLRYPVLNSRTSLGWEGKLLDGRVSAASSMSLRLWSSSVQQSDTAGSTVLVALPGGMQLDWENRLQIKTFAIFWRLENLLDDRQIPAVGWTPPGIRSGWGITWNFGG